MELWQDLMKILELEKNKMHTIKSSNRQVTIKEEIKKELLKMWKKGLKESLENLEIEVINHEEVGT